MKNKPKIGIFGMGAIGCSIAAELVANQNIDLRAFNRSPRGGIHIMRDNELQSLSLQVETVAHETTLDWLIVCLKEYQFEEAQNWLNQLISMDTRIVVIRNGIYHESSVLDLINREQILPCIIDCPTQLESKNIYRQYGRPLLSFPNRPLAVEFSSFFHGSHTTVNLIDDFHSVSWQKLCESAALGSVLCLAGETTWIFNENPKLQELYCNILKECITVARADGANISDDFIDKMVEKLSLYPDDKSSSMLVDRQEGRPIELMAKNGMVAKLGEKYYVYTPLNDLIYTLLNRTNKGDYNRQ